MTRFNVFGEFFKVWNRQEFLSTGFIEYLYKNSQKYSNRKVKIFFLILQNDFLFCLQKPDKDLQEGELNIESSFELAYFYSFSFEPALLLESFSYVEGVVSLESNNKSFSLNLQKFNIAKNDTFENVVNKMNIPENIKTTYPLKIEKSLSI